MFFLKVRVKWLQKFLINFDEEWIDALHFQDAKAQFDHAG